jgi:hypothetical protein
LIIAVECSGRFGVIVIKRRHFNAVFWWLLKGVRFQIRHAQYPHMTSILARLGA